MDEKNVQKQEETETNTAVKQHEFENVQDEKQHSAISRVSRPLCAFYPPDPVQTARPPGRSGIPF